MSSERAKEILYESHAALRLVDNELNQLLDDDPADVMDVGMVGYPQLMEDASGQLQAVIEKIRERRAAAASSETQLHQALMEVESRLLEVADLFNSNQSSGFDHTVQGRGHELVI